MGLLKVVVTGERFFPQTLPVPASLNILQADRTDSKYSLLEGVQKVLPNHIESFRRKPESRFFKTFWTPALAGVTGEKGFLDTRFEL